MPLVVAGCGAADDHIEAKPAPRDLDEHVGERVTISAPVTRVITPMSTVVDAREYGQRSLLVLSVRPHPGLMKGDVLIMSGLVREFEFDAMQKRYALPDSGVYRPFSGESVLAGARGYAPRG